MKRGKDICFVCEFSGGEVRSFIDPFVRRGVPSDYGLKAQVDFGHYIEGRKWVGHKRERF